MLLLKLKPLCPGFFSPSEMRSNHIIIVHANDIIVIILSDRILFDCRSPGPGLCLLLSLSLSLSLSAPSINASTDFLVYKTRAALL